ncbi:phosphoethanolamine transferase [Enterovibrio paralichthyis]|uniref:phosphoethanolamine transferase n=1 Tax=Enterovibrio paralichthyis TaxID=2853805 RepID=UPI001C4808B8|nr:phosphoethanolamine--lipid A transferase [Enterovibrio paralichthyis]MBV7297451.1 phosphoethanolamine--lipid A transferase [Enterovibrio paralichthyis]
MKIKPIPMWLATMILAAYFALFMNLPIYDRLVEIFHGLEHVDPVFVATIPFFFFFSLNVIFNVFAWPYLFRPFFALLVLVSSAVTYAGFFYGTIFDQDMLVNIVETNTSEATSYISFASIGWITAFGILPALAILFVPISKKGVLHLFGTKLLSVVISLVAIGAIAAGYYQDYASIGRNNSYLKRVIIPTHFVYSGYQLVKDRYFSEPIPYKQIGLDAVQEPKANPDKPDLLVFVLGETARAQNFEYTGYPRETNAFTKQEEDVVFFKDVSSCGTATAVSVPCMFSNMTRDNFDREQADNQDDVVDILSRAGIDVYWKENDGGDKGVAKHIHRTEVNNQRVDDLCNGSTCFDMALLEGMDGEIADMKGDRVIALHIIGSHGPTYFQRYPKDMAYFQPDCPRADIENCSVEEIVNTYDNTIRYTDYVLSQLIKKLKALEGQYNTALFFISDHGESLGENGLFLHGMPYALAPETQTRVPMLFWSSPGFDEDKGLDKQCLQSNTGKPYSQDNLFHSLLGLMDVKTNAYDGKMDIFSPCRQ